MTYGEFKAFVMQLIDQYSANGVELTKGYNDQADFFARIPAAYNAVMLELAAGPCPILAVMDRETLETAEQPGYVEAQVPEDFLRMTGDGLPMVREGRMTRIKDYWMVGADRVMIRKSLFDGAILEYCRRPATLEADPASDTVLDGTAEMLTAAAYYVAALLVLREDAFLYAALRNEYDDRVTEMKKARRRAETFFVQDVYGP